MKAPHYHLLLSALIALLSTSSANEPAAKSKSLPPDILEIATDNE